VGARCLLSNISGKYNTAVGKDALYSNTTGNYNTAVGKNALYSNTTGKNNTAIGSNAGYNCNGDGNVFIGKYAGYSYSGDSALYIDDANNSIPLIYGDFNSRRLGFGTKTPGAKLEINSNSGESPLWARINNSTKLKVHSNGSVSIGTPQEGPGNGLISHGNMIPTDHRSYDLGTSTKAWDDIYYDDLHNMGASAFGGRNPSEEILNYPPKEKLPGSFDYKTERGDVELDPNSMPPGLADEGSLLTDEMTSYNYKTNYEQQILINHQKKEIETLKNEIETLKKLLQNLENKMLKTEK
jgi:hypothetical protein